MRLLTKKSVVFSMVVVMFLGVYGHAADQATSTGDASGVKESVKKSSKTKKKSKLKLKFDAMMGGGVDSNVLNKKKGEKTGGAGEIVAKLKLGVPVANWMTWGNQLGFGSSYRYISGQDDPQALKMSIKVKTGLEFLLFGNRSLPTNKVPKKAQRYPAGRLKLAIKYGYNFNPVLNVPGQNELPLLPVCDPTSPEYDPEDPACDPFLDDSLDEADADMDADADEDLEEDLADDEEDDEESADEEASEEEEEEEAFMEDSPMEGKFFNEKPGKHNISGGLSFIFEPVKKTGITLAASGARALVDPNTDFYGDKPMPNFSQFGIGLMAKQKIVKWLSVTGGYKFDYRAFDEKVDKETQDPITNLSHGLVVGFSIKPIKILKFKLGYKYKLRQVPVNDTMDSGKHQLGLGAQIKINKSVAIVAQTAFSSSASFNAEDTTAANRFVGMLGVAFKI